MYVPADVAGATADRLRKFILRAQVKIERENDLGILGLGGPAAFDLVQGEVAHIASARLAIASIDDARVVRLSAEQFLIVAASDDMPVFWAKLTQHATPVGAECWSWLQIQARTPWITAATRDQFLPQMIGLDAVGGVSFDKGCYAGQEIIARSRYLGEIKRRLRPGHTRAGVRPGEALSLNGQQCATVLNSACIPEGGSDFLAVVSEQVDIQSILQTSTGEPVRLSAPPDISIAG
jgi:folate-binding protein YgfZ